MRGRAFLSVRSVALIYPERSSNNPIIIDLHGFVNKSHLQTTSSCQWRILIASVGHMHITLATLQLSHKVKGSLELPVFSESHSCVFHRISGQCPEIQGFARSRVALHRCQWEAAQLRCNLTTEKDQL